MTTLAEASHSERRNRTFVGKPRQISSGVPLTRVQRVAHRSDILLDDQVIIFFLEKGGGGGGRLPNLPQSFTSIV